MHEPLQLGFLLTFTPPAAPGPLANGILSEVHSGCLQGVSLRPEPTNQEAILNGR